MLVAHWLGAMPGWRCVVTILSCCYTLLLTMPLPALPQPLLLELQLLLLRMPARLLFGKNLVGMARSNPALAAYMTSTLGLQDLLVHVHHDIVSI